MRFLKRGTTGRIRANSNQGNGKKKRKTREGKRVCWKQRTPLPSEKKKKGEIKTQGQNKKGGKKGLKRGIVGKRAGGPTAERKK